ncbi:MAG TPA: hypothetical protein VK550_00600 [Polyangiaceae bacterium]|nr:hypothetical protein [Polyangiaceae bacterium]
MSKRKVSVADTWGNECLARRRKLIEAVVAEEVMLDEEFGNSRPHDLFDVPGKALQFQVSVWQNDDPVEEEEWLTSWQLGYWKIGDRWRFVLVDEIMPPGLSDGRGLMAPAIPLVDAPTAAVLYYGRRIKRYADRVRHTISINKATNSRRGGKRLSARS